MSDLDRLIIKLAAIGGIIGLAKLFVSDEEITLKLLLGRVILGSAISLTAGVALIHFSKLDELALIGIACTLGISGQTGIEWLFKRSKKGAENETQ